MRLKARSSKSIVSRRKISAAVSVERVGYSSVPGHQFKACVSVAFGRRPAGSRKKFIPGTQCDFGKNPRAAIAAALRKSATAVSRRKGAFAGL